MVGGRVAAPSNARETRPRDADAAAFADAWPDAPALQPGAPERVYEHDVAPGADGWCSATVTHGPLELEVRWDAATMPRMWQWVHPSYGVLGLEPANCSVLGVAHDRAEGRLPELAPGEERRTRLEIRAERSSARCDEVSRATRCTRDRLLPRPLIAASSPRSSTSNWTSSP